jgi:hypothetical protein
VTSSITRAKRMFIEYVLGFGQDVSKLSVSGCNRLPIYRIFDIDCELERRPPVLQRDRGTPRSNSGRPLYRLPRAGSPSLAKLLTVGNPVIHGRCCGRPGDRMTGRLNVTFLAIGVTSSPAGLKDTSDLAITVRRGSNKRISGSPDSATRRMPQPLLPSPE